MTYLATTKKLILNLNYGSIFLRKGTEVEPLGCLLEDRDLERQSGEIRSEWLSLIEFDLRHCVAE